MDKKDLIPGKTYLRKHKATMHSRYGNKEAEAEGYIECMQVTPAVYVSSSIFSGNEILY